SGDSRASTVPAAGRPPTTALANSASRTSRPPATSHSWWDAYRSARRLIGIFRPTTRRRRAAAPGRSPAVLFPALDALRPPAPYPAARNLRASPDTRHRIGAPRWRWKRSPEDWRTTGSAKLLFFPGRRPHEPSERPRDRRLQP